ncbi:MAG: carbonic anhydrase [Acidobacteriota bacterium]
MPRDAREVWSALLEGNRRFAAGKPLRRDLLRERAALVVGQAPAAAVLACSDSRVPPEYVFDAGLGELFVVRTAGHFLSDAALGSLEFAVHVLGVPLLVVLGHEGCGAVQAAVAARAGRPVEGPPALANLVRSVAESLPEVLPEIRDEAAVCSAMVRRHVAATVRALRRAFPSPEGNSSPAILGAVYNLASGAVEPVAEEWARPGNPG